MVIYIFDIKRRAYRKMSRGDLNTLGQIARLAEVVRSPDTTLHAPLGHFD